MSTITAEGCNAYRLYRNELLHLTKESRKIITHLTTIAQTNYAHHEPIAKALVDHTLTVNHPLLVPAIYLVDSLSKTLSCYRDQFAKHIIQLFLKAYETANQSIRNELLTLRRTWGTTFDSYTLYTLDREIDRLSKHSIPQNRQRTSLVDLQKKTQNLLGTDPPVCNVPLDRELIWPYGPELNHYKPPSAIDCGLTQRKSKLVCDEHFVTVDDRAIPIELDKRIIVSLSSSMRGRCELLCSSRTRTLLINSQPILVFGSDPVKYSKDGHDVMIGYVGPRINIWIDGYPHELRLDVVLQRIVVQGNEHDFRVDGVSKQLYVNNREVGFIDPMKPILASFNEGETPHEIRFAPHERQIMIDGSFYTMRFDCPLPCVEIAGRFYGIRFDSSQAREILIDGIPHIIAFDRSCRVAFSRDSVHQVAWGGPGYEVIIDGRPYELAFNSPERMVYIGCTQHRIQIVGETPIIKILGEMPFSESVKCETRATVQSPQTKNSTPTTTKPTFDATIFSQCFTNAIEHFSRSWKNPQSSQYHLVAMPATNSMNSQINPQAVIANLFSAESQPPVAQYKTVAASAPPVTSMPSATAQLVKRPPPPLPPPPPVPEPKSDGFDTDMIQAMYRGTPCQQCGLRFDVQGNDCPFLLNAKPPDYNRKRFDHHLDRHFMLNKRAKGILYSGNRPPRGWMLNRSSWVEQDVGLVTSEKQVPEIDRKQPLPDVIVVGEDLKRRGAFEGLFEDERDLGKAKKPRIAKPRPPMCPALTEMDEVCRVCREGFEQIYDRDQDEWMNVNAVRNEHGCFHAICAGDFKEDEDVDREEEPPEEPTPILTFEELEEMISSITGNPRSTVAKKEIKEEAQE